MMLIANSTDVPMIQISMEFKTTFLAYFCLFCSIDSWTKAKLATEHERGNMYRSWKRLDEISDAAWSLIDKTPERITREKTDA